MIIKQEKSDKELEQASSKIIDLLHNFNLAEKYKILSSLSNYLLDIIKSYGGSVVDFRK